MVSSANDCSLVEINKIVFLFEINKYVIVQYCHGKLYFLEINVWISLYRSLFPRHLRSSDNGFICKRLQSSRNEYVTCIVFTK